MRGHRTPGLTRRQRQVLYLAAQGKSNREIGEALDLAYGTIRNHMHAAMRAVGARSRTEAVIRALLAGYIELPGMYLEGRG